MQIYLIRHGQAGRRDDYDRLSELGQEQVRRLSQYFVASGIGFDRVVSGGLRRQQQTAMLLSQSFETDARWSEFDLDAVYRAVAPQLASRDERFRRDYEDLEVASQDPLNAVHRTWRQTDRDVVMAWVRGDVDTQGLCESWGDFVLRVRQAWEELMSQSKIERIAICTSATPIGLTFSPDPAQAFLRAGAIYNSSFTILEGFNQTPHLAEARLLTLR